MWGTGHAHAAERIWIPEKSAIAKDHRKNQTKQIKRRCLPAPPQIPQRRYSNNEIILYISCFVKVGGVLCLDERTPGYYAVIPASVRYDDRIPANAKLLYGEISALISSEGFCYAANSYFSELYKVSERTISSLISKLKDAGHITLQIERDETGLIKRRKLFLTVSTIDGQPQENIFYTPGKDFREGIENNFQYTNTSNTDICKENKKESPPEEKSKGVRTPKTDFDPLPLFVAWIGDTFSDLAADGKNAIYFALVRFSENRTAIKKPMKSKASVTALCNRLLKNSAGCQDRVGMIIDMLDTATSSGWQSVYPPKNISTAKSQKPQSGRCYEEL